MDPGKIMLCDILFFFHIKIKLPLCFIAAVCRQISAEDFPVVTIIRCASYAPLHYTSSEYCWVLVTDFHLIIYCLVMEQKRVCTRGALLLQNAAKVIEQRQLTVTKKENKQPCSRKRVVNRHFNITSTQKQVKKVTAKFFRSK